MKTRVVRLGVLALVVGGLLLALVLPATAAVAAAAPLEGRGPGGWRGGPGATRGIAAGPLTAAEKDALQRAMDEEYVALNTYRAVIDQFGAVTPFSAIARSEQQHVAALTRLFTKYGLAVPANDGEAAATHWDSLAAACQTGVEIETADGTLYDELMRVTNRADLIRVFTSLQSASLNNHLPAFEACN